LSYADSRIHVVVGDANESQTFEKVSQISDRFDIIIDDGSHRSDDILNSFNIYFPLLKPGGIFIVEDTHALYENGGLKQIKSAMAFFKLFADLVNYEFWKSDSTIEKLLNGFVSKTQLTDEVNAGWVESIEFRNSMIIIRKELTPTHSKLGARSIVGTEAVANDLVLKIKLGKVRSWKNPKTWF
jgi:SAM-dependent methyltransferase